MMIAGLIAGLGMKIFDNYAESAVVEGIEKVTGVKLNKETSEADKELIRANAGRIEAELKLIYADKKDARSTAVALANSVSNWLVKSTGSIIALVTVIGTFSLWGYMLIGTIEGVDKTMLMAVNSSLTLALGYVLAFYFGSSKSEADTNRRSE